MSRISRVQEWFGRSGSHKYERDVQARVLTYSKSAPAARRRRIMLAWPRRKALFKALLVYVRKMK
jgi:hypothetical protein